MISKGEERAGQLIMTKGGTQPTKDNTGLVQERKEGNREKILSAALLRKLTKPILIGLAIVIGSQPACLRCIWLLQDLPKKRYKKEPLIKVGTIPHS